MCCSLVIIQYLPADLCPLRAKRLGFETVDTGGVTFCHKTEDININIRIHGSSEGNVLAFGNYFIECDFNLCPMY